MDQHDDLSLQVDRLSCYRDFTSTLAMAKRLYIVRDVG